MQLNDWSSAPAAPTRHNGRSHALLHAAGCMLAETGDFDRSPPEAVQRLNWMHLWHPKMRQYRVKVVVFTVLLTETSAPGPKIDPVKTEVVREDARPVAPVPVFGSRGWHINQMSNARDS
ncbi:hypothetical protein CTAM01_13955 [Colletotrichum tamarilloi]|uniref:Uncharacterized protein n=1 Tax=Colletotrichum tamarilloi TaxID=1209934 RepID=A0ABQ9QQV1_9PEZI|nr:uncharacterized protein CTAM01_13955 [Colletotrichum tamarilloi]KAK1481598.1 hypothetical protein CTAM01_13955 [Colletotrichum tamarilloi]